MGPKVSIITANHNKAVFFGESINSVLEQTYKNWEMIFIDDCSTDGSLELVKTQFKDERIKSSSTEKRSGANVCRNMGIKMSTGEYVIFLDADDILVNTCIEGRVKEMQKDPSLDMCVFAMGVFDKVIGDAKHIWRPTSKQPLIDFLQHDLPWSILQPIWKKKVLVEAGGFDENFGRLQDVEIHTRILFEKNIKFKQFPQIVDCHYRVGDDRRSANTFDYNMPRVIGSLGYYSKFYAQAKANNIGGKLLGTIYQTYLQCIYHTRYGKMTKQQFLELEKKLIDRNILKLNGIKNAALKFSRFYNFNMPKVPGINHVLNKIITN